MHATLLFGPEAWPAVNDNSYNSTNQDSSNSDTPSTPNPAEISGNTNVLGGDNFLFFNTLSLFC